MAYSDLTAEQKEDLAEFFRDFRPAWASYHNALWTFKALVATYNQNVAPVWATVNNADVVPDGSGLANSGTMTKADWAALITLANNIQAELFGAGGVSAVNWPDSDTITSNAVLAAGPGNITGQ